MALDRIECVEVFAADGLGAGIRPLAVLACASGGTVRLKQRRVLRGGPAKAGEPRSRAYVREAVLAPAAQCSVRLIKIRIQSSFVNRSLALLHF